MNIPITILWADTDTLYVVLAFHCFLISTGSGERSAEPPGYSTETVPAVEAENFCAGLYKSESFRNLSTPLHKVMKTSISWWPFSGGIHSLYLYQVGLAIELPMHIKQFQPCFPATISWNTAPWQIAETWMSVT